MSRPTVYQQLRDAVVKQELSPDQAAESVLHRTPKAELAALLRPLLVAQAQRWVRRETRSLEVEVDAALAAGSDPISVRRRILNESFCLPSGEYVLWGEATPDQHRARAGWQRNVAARNIEDAERHEAAAAAIESVPGATCLLDVDAIAAKETAA